MKGIAPLLDMFRLSINGQWGSSFKYESGRVSGLGIAHHHDTRHYCL